LIFGCIGWQTKNAIFEDELFEVPTEGPRIHHKVIGWWHGRWAGGASERYMYSRTTIRFVSLQAQQILEDPAYYNVDVVKWAIELTSHALK
jgi:hypothetical protein